MTYTVDIVNICINHLIELTPIKHISKMLSISEPTIRKWHNLYNNFIENKIFLTDNDYNKKDKKHGSTIKHLYSNEIINYVNENEGCSYCDILNKINNKISASTLCRILKENNITRKRFKTRIVCKNIDEIIEARIQFCKDVSNNKIIIDNAISIDEVSFCVNEVKNYGFSKKNKEIKKLLKHKHNKERLSVITAIDKNKVIAYEIHNKGINGDKYLDFFKKNIDNFKDRYILQDNVRIHYYYKLKDYALENNIKLQYIPAYTPEFNPIELIFSKVKKIFRKLEHKNITDDIIESLSKITKTDTTHFYDHTIDIIKKTIA
jgi:transposase